MPSDLVYIIALMSIPGVGSSSTRHLLEAFGSAKAVFEADNSLLITIPRIGQTLVANRKNPALMERAQREIEFIESHHIKVLIYGQEGYPRRLMECPDAPALLFYLGNANLDSAHMVGIVGTRACTQAGRDTVHQFVHDLQEALPDTVIVSGLALGIDIEAHKASLDAGLNTVGVVAHGLDRIYPAPHRPIARQMIAAGGGTITEYTTGTTPERGNFLARNRIIAGLCDAIIVAESKDSGGSLVTAAIALDYNREVFAFPGRSNDERSKGCNRLIRLNRAGLITSAHDFLESMGWATTTKMPQAIQQSIPFEEEELSPSQRIIVDTLREQGDLRLSQIADITGLEHTILLEDLLDLEMNNKLRNTPGGTYQLK